MHTRLLVITLVVASLVMAVVGTVAFAQRNGGPGGGPGGAGQGPGGPGMGPMRGQMMPPQVQMHFAGGSLYLLQGNRLVKYHGATLKELGAVTLGGGTTTAPQGRGPAAFLVAGDDVLLVADNTFYRIAGKTMKIEKQAALPAPGTAGQGPERIGPLRLELGGRTLFVLAGNRLYSIETATGKVLGQTEVKLPPFAPPAGMGPGGRRMQNPGK